MADFLLACVKCGTAAIVSRDLAVGERAKKHLEQCGPLTLYVRGQLLGCEEVAPVAWWPVEQSKPAREFHGWDHARPVSESPCVFCASRVHHMSECESPEGR